MRIADASSARIWSLERNKRLVGPDANRTASLYLEAAKRVAAQYPTVTPESSGHYLEGRRNLEIYQRSLVNIREAAYGHGLNLRNARLTDEQIERVIERMNLTPR
jgi:hypothetical protein